MKNIQHTNGLTLFCTPSPALRASSPSRARWITRGFTLIELLVVVLIIGVLTTVAVSQYQKAVYKSRFSAMMPIAKTIANANEVYYTENGQYASTPAQLSVSAQENAEDGTEVSLYSNPEELSFVLAHNDNVPNIRYVVYQKFSANFPDTAWCEAGDERAEDLCVSLGGIIPEGVTGNSSGQADNWKAYLLSGTAQAGDTFASAGTDGENPGDEPSENTEPEPQTPTCPAGSVCNEQGTVMSCNSGYYLDGSSCAAVGGCPMSMLEQTTSKSSATCTQVCEDTTDPACYKWTDGANYSQSNPLNAGNSLVCGAYESYDCAGSTYSGQKIVCLSSVANGCMGSIFNGTNVGCWAETDNACVGSIFQAGSYCKPSTAGGCNGVKYGTNPNHTGAGVNALGSCWDNEGNCPVGVPIFKDLQTNWNSNTKAFNYTWKGNCCNPAYMVSGVCPDGIAVCS